MESNRLTALKTTSLRLRGTSVDILNEEGLDSEGVVTSKSKLQSQVKALSGVDILTATGEYKSTYEILSQIADVWEDINDMDQAALLELISGKRNSSVIAAILQNPKELKEAFEDAQNAEGSALRENEKYLDSIQGRIDLFTNAVQTMWQNTLNSDVVKFFVDLGTKIIQIIDKIGLFRSLLIALATYSMVKNKMGPIAFLGGISDGIRKVVGKIGGFIGSLTRMTAATSAYTAETLAASVANGALSASEAANIASKNGLALATTSLTAAEATSILTKAGVVQADALAIVSQLGLTKSTQALTVADIEAAVSLGMLTEAQGTQAIAALFGAGANKTLAASLGALWTALWPVLAVMAGIAAIYGIVKLIDHLVVTTEELTEQLNDLKSELESIQTELDSVNSELETTQDRMAELLAMDSLSFTEEEELRNLQKQNDELQRRLDLLKDEEKRKAKDTADKFIETMNSDLEKQDVIVDWRGGRKKKKAVKVTEKEYIDSQLATYESADDKEKEKIEDYMFEKISELKTNADGLDYGINDETDVWLDYIYNLEDKWAIASGGTNAKTNAIKRIFNKKEFNGVSEEINGLLEELKENPNDQTILDKILEQCKFAEKDLNAVGLSAENAFKYFTMESSSFNSSTIEGVTAQYAKGIKVFQDYKDKGMDANAVIGKYFDIELDKDIDITWGSLFDENGDVIETEISKALQGADETARKEFARLAKSIKEGKITVEQALEAFSAKGLVESWKLVEIQISELNADVFKDLGDEISGVINTVDELSSAFESVADSIDLVNQAQAEMAYSGHLSVETALQLMDSTDNWNELLKIEDGNIKLVDGAEQALVQTKLDLIKTNLQTALSTVEAQLAQITATESSADMAYTIEESTNLAVTELAGNMAYLTKIMEAYAKIAAGEDIILEDYMNAANDAKELVKSQTDYKKNAAEAIGREDLEKEKARLEAMLEMYQTVDTPSEFEDNYSSDKVSGGNDTVKDVEESEREKLIEYYENRLSANAAKQEQIQNEIDLAEKMGMKADKSYYDEKLKLMVDQEALLTQKKADLLVELGKTTEGSDEWWEIANELNDIEGELDDVTASIVDLQDAIGEIDTYQFDEFSNRLDKLTSKLQTMRDLMAPNGEEDWFDDEGKFTEKGTAVLGSYLQELEFYKQGLAQVEADMAEFDNTSYNDLTQDQRDSLTERGIHSEQEYYDWVTKLDDEQLKYLSSISDTEVAIGDMYEASIDAVEEYTQTLVESYNDYIDACKEALDAERDLYSFKKDVQKQNKDIASLERRIAALSASTNASDIAEKRKLEAQLAEQKEALNDTYYEHSKESQQNALDAEAQAYEESMNRFVENLRTNLDTALENMDSFLAGVSASVMINAQVVRDQYTATGATLDDAIVEPWDAAIAAIGTYETDGLSKMNAWTTDAGFFGKFADGAQDKLTGFWGDGIKACDGFKSSINSTLTQISTNIATNVAKWREDIASAYDDVKDTEENPPKLQGQGTPPASTPNQPKSYTERATLTGSAVGTISADGTGKTKALAQLAAKTALMNLYLEQYKKQNNLGTIDGALRATGAWTKEFADPKFGGKGKKIQYEALASGTLNKKQSGFAITDESWIGEEITLAAGKNGQLQYLKKGSAVMPADISANLVEWGKLNPDMMKIGGGANLNMISNAVNKPELNFAFDSLVHVDNCSQETLKDLEKMVDNKINQFSKQMNYAIKRIGGR